ncbi:CHAT domain-containing protein [Rhodoferax sp.]|uniref:CHAT domain-containing protein n=1 Tax=Rhodoferax sp. TaxID=50421 RepID=UPI00374D8A86
MAAGSPIVFLAHGDALPVAGAAVPRSRGAKAAVPKTRAVRLSNTARGAATLQRLEAVPGEDLVLLTIGSVGNSGDGRSPDLQLRLHPEHARDLLRAQAAGAARGTGAVALDPGAVLVPLAAQWPGQAAASRGALDLVFKGLALVGIDVGKVAAQQTAKLLGKKLDSQVKEGVYRLQLASLGSLKQATATDIAPSAEPTLVLLHGTFVDTASSFGKLWTLHHGLVQQLFANYANRVYALDHGTVLASPIANALTLAKRLPQDARLHLVTHSRGGLVAEVLLRASQGVTAADLAVFAGDSYAQHRQDLQALGDLLTAKNVRVERVVRVACPAYGTLLASNRLDAYLSALAWLLERSGLPPIAAMVDFANAVARERTDAASLPGIEAMRRSSALIGWLNSPLPATTRQPLDSGLRVVAGDIAGDSLVSWVKTLLADSYYWTDNDLVVQTSAMYGGVPRGDDALFLLERSGSTDHFRYFENDGTANGVARALLQAQPDGFAPIGPLSRKGESATGSRGLPRDAAALGDGSRPAVIVLPGILGSNLKRGSEREWLVWWRLPGLINRIALDQPDISEDGPIGRYYDDLLAHLGASHDVLPFGYDWRLNLADSAALLAAQVATALARRQGSGQPVRLLAHSMGSLVLRVMRLNHSEVWQKMMDRAGARVLLLGPPNGGSWAPMTIYTGDDSFGQFLSTVGGAFQEEAARQKMVAFPGLVQMQAGLTDPELSLGDASHWQQLADRDFQAAQQSHTWHNTDEQVAAYRWAVPSQSNLDAAAALRRQLDAQAGSLGADAAKMAIVLGQAPATPCGLRWVDAGMQYLSTPEGDGRVTWEAACLPGVATWQTDHAHGDLPTIQANFAAYTELLVRGRTEALAAFAPSSRGVPRAAPRPLATLARLRDGGVPSTGLPVGEESLLAAALGGREPAALLSRGTATVSGVMPLTVELVHGDLRFVREPLLLGHFRSLELTGTEWVLNGLLGNALQESLDLRLYPVRPGQHQIFANRHIDPSTAYPFPRPEAAIVVGLGDEGELQPNTLTDAVRQAVLAFQRHTAGQRGAVDVVQGVSLASTSLGSGGNLTVSQSVTAMVRGVMDANARLAAAQKPVNWPPVTRLLVVELYHNRVLEAWQALRAACDAGTIAIQLLPQVRATAGARSEPAGGVYRGAGYDLVRVSQRQCEPGASQAELEFSVYTKRARSEVRGKGTQRVLVDAIVAAAETDTRYDADLARSLFQLLVPQEIKAYLGTANTLMFEVDASTAAYPWELLEDGDAEQPGTRLPWALRLSGTLLRKMRVEQFRREPSDANTHDVLVVGAPHLDPAQGLPDLPGAMAEAEAVAALFGSDAKLLLDQDFLDIVKPALARPWKVIHLAGHGQYDQNGEHSGMLMSGNCLLSPTEFESMASVPELVFVNCCHLGKTENSPRRNHALFAANVAEQLIRNGVRCVVAAGWAVDDAAALAFATAFYTALAAEATFAEAVSRARRAAHDSNPGSNTWAAYQCYGDPAWTLRRSESSGTPRLRRSVTPSIPTEGELMIALEAVRLDAQNANDSSRLQLVEQLVQLQSVATDEWKAHGRVAEALGLAWRDVDEPVRALDWLQKAVTAADGTASLAAREQQLNIQARQAGSVADLTRVVAQIRALVELAPTAERYSILGSAYKRLVMHKDAAAKLPAYLDQMQQAYAEAEKMNPPNLFYPLMQRCMAQLRRHWLLPASPGPTAEDFAAVLRSFTQRDAQSPDFWSVDGQQELTLLEGVTEGRLAARLDGILAGLNDLHLRVRNKHFWSSVNDTAQFLLPAYIQAASQKQEKDAARRYLELVATFD